MPKTKRASIIFQYFQVCCMDGDEVTERLFPLSDWINQMVDTDLDARNTQLPNIFGRLDDIKNTSPNNFYGFDFMRMDEISDAYKVKEDSKAEHIDLDPDEYMGKSTAAIYDNQRNIIMIQKNRAGYSSVSINAYINATSQVGKCYLRPVINIVALEDCMINRVAKLQVRFANVRAYRPGESAPMERIVAGMNDMECVSGYVEVGMGYNRIESLKRDTVCEAVRDIRNNHDNIHSAQIALSDDRKTDILDLFDNIEKSRVSFVLPARGELGFEERINQMDTEYTDKIPAIMRALYSDQ